MLYPQQNAARLTISLDGIWDFALGSGGPCCPQSQPCRPPAGGRARWPTSPTCI